MAMTEWVERKPLRERLRLFRLDARLSLDEAAALSREHLPEWVPMSRELVRRLESGRIPEERMNSLQLLALARVYGVDPAWLEPHGDGGEKLRKLGLVLKPDEDDVAQTMTCFTVGDAVVKPSLQLVGAASENL